jgi:ppGpp synthetase/RelA/SpoT-type nucleotidyltranferase
MENKYSEKIINQYNSKLSDYVSFCQNIEYLVKRLLEIEKINYYSLNKRVKTIKNLKNKLIKRAINIRLFLI